MSHSEEQKDVVIDSVFFAQTHVMEPHHPYFRLSGGRDALIRAVYDVVDPDVDRTASGRPPRKAASRVPSPLRDRC